MGKWRYQASESAMSQQPRPDSQPDRKQVFVARNQPKIIVLTGATRGLGLAMAEKFIELGHTVLGCGRSREGAENLRRKFSPLTACCQCGSGKPGGTVGGALALHAWVARYSH